MTVHQYWAGKDPHPAYCDLSVGPRHCLILVNSDHGVIVVAHDSVGAQINGKYRTNQFDAVDDPLTPVFKVKTGSYVFATQKCASYTP
jgi:hypothetical protein